VALVTSVFLGCTPHPSEPGADPEPLQKKPAVSSPSAPLPDTPRDLSSPSSNVTTPTVDADVMEASADCQRAIERVRRAPGLPGAPGLEENRPLVLLYAKAEPVVFVEKPSVDRTSSPEAVRYRAMIENTESPWSTIQRLWMLFSMKPDLGRSVLLRDGYLYAENPLHAFALVDLVSAQTLFSDDRIWIQRGERQLTAERTKSGNYVFVDGPEQGQRVRLLLFDRIGTGTPPVPIHRDFRTLRMRLGFDRVSIKHLTEGAIVADLRYGSVWVPTLLDSQGAHLELRCDTADPETRKKVLAFRKEQERKERVLATLRRAMVDQVEDGLPFDEPNTEYGQQDGRLRREWLRAYEAGKRGYEFQEDIYEVFNANGRPLVPQVCVDFLFDSLERASGTHYRSRGEKRERVMGTLDFGTMANETRRRATSFIEYAQARPESFDVHMIPESERVEFKYGQKFANYLVREADHFAPGDVVMIRGYTPWDKRNRLMHFHSFFVYESDPLTGQAMILAGNPGKPLLQTWQFEAFRTPDRSIWYRVRPHIEWLASVIQPSTETPLLPAPLAADRR
ncbi:MAG TPA: hypothetical protein VMS65_16790, partial [Polyangiaceae bacterium]|nr:hypothetical protein [Polyangiaceae bacterium]